MELPDSVATVDYAEQEQFTDSGAKESTSWSTFESFRPRANAMSFGIDDWLDDVG